MTVYTIGHSTRRQDELISLLRLAGVKQLVDVRSFPRSRANPQFNADVLAAALSEAGIGYRHLKALGGQRGAQNLAGPSPNGLWKEEAFRNYADYALTPAFRDGLATLVGLAEATTCAIMCAEAVWWRCLRRIVSDYLLAREIEVRHILGPDKIEPAVPTPGAEPQADGTVHYPAPQGELF